MKLKIGGTTILQYIVLSVTLLGSSVSAALSVKVDTLKSTVVYADDPDIQYVGRFDFSNSKKVVFDWAGVYIITKFEGTSCSIILDDHKNEYDVIIDNHAPELLSTNKSTIYKVASGLDESITHTIMIQKRTEALVGHAVFMGFILDKGKRTLPPDQRPYRRIEVIGNSITSGYGVEGENTNCHFSPQTENACMSYAAIAARALNADYSLVSYSGRGVVRNYGDKNKTSINPMPSLYDRTCFYDSTKKWDFEKWIPQVVIINLGTNDFSTQPFPDKNVFQKAYSKLINRVRSLYPHVTIFCMCGPMIGEPCLTYIKGVVSQQQKREDRDKDVFLVEINRNLFNDSDWGCDWHPNINGSVKTANILTPIIKLRMHW
jgi:Carbohydrate esterase 2 N-terminal/GDSL-like Lipase/Acylhydrolase family